MDPATLKRLEERRAKKRKLNAITSPGGSSPASESGGNSVVRPFSSPAEVPSVIQVVEKEASEITTQIEGIPGTIEETPATAHEIVVSEINVLIETAEICEEIVHEVQESHQQAGLLTSHEADRLIESSSIDGAKDKLPEIGPSPQPSSARFKAMLEQLQDFLGPVERGSRGIEHQVGEALRSFVQVGNFLSNFIGTSSEASSLELRVAREKAEDLEYYLDLEKKASAQLTKELNFSEEALRDAHETINRRDMALTKVEEKAEDLRKQRSDAQRGCRRACSEMNRLKTVLADRQCSPRSEPRSVQRSLRTGEGPSSMPISISVTKLQKEISHLKKRLEEEKKEKEYWIRSAGMGNFLYEKAEAKETRMARKGAKIINSVCTSAFSAGFERCKRMAQNLLPDVGPENLKMDPHDECLKAVVEDGATAFHAVTGHSYLAANKCNKSTQTEDEFGDAV